QLAADLRFSDQVLVGELPVPYSGTDNEERRVAEQLNVTEQSELPAVILYRKEDLECPVRFPADSSEFTANQIRHFVRDTIPTLRLQLESCVPELDKLAAKFVASQKPAERQELLQKAKKVADKFAPETGEH